jgi:pantoate--beta-alanine ligase
MRIVKSVSSMQRLALRWRAASVPVGFVPTMGYLHDGHISLFHEARRRIGTTGQVVVSIYVNPTQFGPREDFTKYPRDLERDSALCRQAGVDVLFLPYDEEIYPRSPGQEFSTFVVEESLSRRMEGQSRPTHFRGVTTIVAKLFNLVLPTVAVFGQKDYQQAAVIQRMGRDLNFAVKIVVAPTLRESDGLAMSSRNKYLSTDERAQAVILWRAIREAQSAVRAAKQPLASARLKRKLTALIATQPSARLDYIEFFHPDTLEPILHVTRGAHLALAVWIGRTRLIDNARL